MGNVGKEELASRSRFSKMKPRISNEKHPWLGYVGCGPIRTISFSLVDPIVRKVKLPVVIYYRKVYRRPSN